MDTRALLLGMGIGSALSFILDPARGGRRRALVRDKLVRGAHATREALDATACDMANRTRGIAAASWGRVTERHVDDATLLERVRAKLGRASSHPRAIDVHVADGVVTLRGPVLASEVTRVIGTAQAVRGVRQVLSELQVHETAESVPSLQGAGRAAGPTLDMLQSRWAPATRALVGLGTVAAAGAALAYGRR